MRTTIVCFGETLWDMLPQGSMPGGAPMNVAIHLTYQGFSPLVISRTGEDRSGNELSEVLQQKRVSTQWIQKDSAYQTGVVQADVLDKNNVRYTIVEPVAWDFIEYDQQVAALVQQSDVFIYGSLAARNQTTRLTLQKYLQQAAFKVFDVNLRPPHYTPELTIQLLKQAQIVKMNHQELAEIMGWHKAPTHERESMEFLKGLFGWQILIVTRAEKGAALLSNQGYIENSGFQVEVEDTIGSGDAFLATFLSNYLHKQPLADCLTKACMIGAFVATQPGATPFYTLSAVEKQFAGS